MTKTKNPPAAQTLAEARKCAETLDLIGQPGFNNSVRLGLVGSLAMTVRHLEAAIVADCREDGWTWDQVGKALDCTKQNAQQRFGV